MKLRLFSLYFLYELGGSIPRSASATHAITLRRPICLSNSAHVLHIFPSPDRLWYPINAITETGVPFSDWLCATPALSNFHAEHLFSPCLPIPRTAVPAGPDWFHEIKHDGYRLIVQREGKRIRLFTRNGYD
jgi:hypothetical protein